jgi:hypothetical protein
MYLFPQKIGIGKFQPYLRYVNVNASTVPTRDVYETGVNYVIDGHNAMVSLSWQHGDLIAPVNNNDLNSMTLGFQWQI